ncbi:phage tail protein [Roseospira visakhapatnamensis]|uniref:Microcystin-dependent protein n=1 Tax=Roseospira visakhapatnamensis TaxID=390880 RepID=A0A7W6RFU8_9PROT|nr:tail fiber protein [Roseospira visakhapatnamensis]MBB4267118.1 microcystin-dependent protein [Roseospira visakhapatnamensis]
MTRVVNGMSVTRTLAGLALGALATMAPPGSATACNGDGTQTIGSICIVAHNFCPRGYVMANGAIIAIADNSALFALIGNRYGGDGRVTFALPDLRGRMPIGVGAGPGLSQVFWGEKRGAEDRVLNTTQGPSRTDTNTATPTPAGGDGDGDGDAAMLSQTSDQRDTSQAGDDPGAPNTSAQGGDPVTPPTGGETPPPTSDQTLGMYYCIAINGIFPQRNN